MLLDPPLTNLSIFPQAMLHYHLRHAHVVELLAFNTDAALGPIVLVMDLLVCSVFDLLHCCDSKPRPPAPDAADPANAADIGDGGDGVSDRRIRSASLGEAGVGLGGGGGGGGGGSVHRGIASSGDSDGGGVSVGSLPTGLDARTVGLPLSVSKRLEMIHDAAQGMLMLHAHGTYHTYVPYLYLYFSPISP